MTDTLSLECLVWIASWVRFYEEGKIKDIKVRGIH